MLTEQQFAALRSELGSTRVAKAMALAGVAQVTLAKALRLTQPYVSDVARGRYRTTTVENGWKFSAYFGLPYRGLVPVTPPTVGLQQDGPSRCCSSRRRQQRKQCGSNAREPTETMKARRRRPAQGVFQGCSQDLGSVRVPEGYATEARWHGRQEARTMTTESAGDEGAERTAR